MCGGGSAVNPGNYANPPGSGGPDIDVRPPSQGPNGPEDNVYYPPLGFLQSCPPEVKTIGEVIGMPSQAPTGKYCVEPYPEPEGCKDPRLINTAQKKADYCTEGPIDGKEVDGYLRICYPDSKGDYDKNNSNNFVCGDKREPSDVPQYGKLVRVFCDGVLNGSPLQPKDSEGNDNAGYRIWQGVQKCAQGQDPGDILGSDGHILRMCMGYFQSKGNVSVEPAKIGPTKLLPACVPTRSANGRCTTTCGDPLKVNALLQMTNIGSCTKGNCAANVNISPDSKLYLPLAQKLNQYFVGTFDAQAVAEGSISQEELDDIQNAIAGRGKYSTGDVTQSEYYDKVQQAFNSAGVARKLLPAEIQDKLKCQFINYVKDKVNKFSNEATRENTKYIYLDNGNVTEFQINGVPVSQIQLPPFIDGSCNRLPRDRGETDDWGKTPSGQAWVNVPLFDNEDSQGAIEFVSASPLVAKPESIKTSLPEIRQLHNVTYILQQALMPAREEGQTLPTPESLGLTIGPPIVPETNLLACKPTPTLKDVYGDTKDYALEPKVLSYTLGVECLQNGGEDLPTDPDSKSQVCSVGIDGQINCTQVSESVATGIKAQEVILQTRNVQPYLFDVFLQTIEDSGGFMRIFKPEAINQDKENEFEEAYKPLPAQSNKIKFEITQSVQGGVTLDDKSKEDGWKLLFDKLGGVWTAHQFVLDLLQP